MTFFRHYSLYFAWLIALISTMITLYLSIIRGMPVCDLCWYQRISMYPLVILLGIAAYREDNNIIIYAIPFAVLGLLFSLIQYLEQMIPGFTPAALCAPQQSCGKIDIIFFGFITLPFLGMVANVAILFLLIIAKCCRMRSAMV